MGILAEGLTAEWPARPGDSPASGPASEPTTLLAWQGRALALLVTCEHAGNRVPEEFAALFTGGQPLLASHRGFDAGALELALALARIFGAPLLATDVTRLVVDANRSPTNPGVFSDRTRALGADVRQRLLATLHAPHRERVARTVEANRAHGLATLHVAAHSFTPVLDGTLRRADVGLLYDPARATERSLCAAWRAALRRRSPDLAVLRNSPYRGVSDGLPTWLRKRFAQGDYLGVELELNQKHLADAACWSALVAKVVQSLQDALDRREPPR